MIHTPPNQRTDSLAPSPRVTHDAVGAARRPAATGMGLLALTLLLRSAAAAGEWKPLPSVPDPHGFAGLYAGVSSQALLVAGGSNFPDPTGPKVWHDRIFVLDRPAGQWQLAGNLPRPLAYGISVTWRNRIVCAGGNDSERHYADVFALEWHAGKIITTALPPLPRPLANACGALLGDTLYVAGGQDQPTATAALKMVLTLDLAAAQPRWQEMAPLPGPGRILAVAAAFDGAFWVCGGAELTADKEQKPQRHYLQDAYRFDPGRGWQRSADLPHPVVAAPTPAPCDATGFYILGGDDGAHVGVAPQRHPGFSPDVLHFSTRTGQWTHVATLPAPRVTTPLVSWNNAWVIPCGEARPRVRSPEVWCFTPGPRVEE